MIDTSTPVLVLRSAHHGGLAVVRTLGRLGVPVYVVEANPQTPAFFSRYCRGRFVWDIDQAPAEETRKHLAEIGRKLGRRAILIPTSDTAALFLADHAGALRQWFLFPKLASSLAQCFYSKKQMYFLARSMGIPSPNSFFPESKQDVMNFADGVPFPIILKAIEARRARNHRARTKVIVRGRQELLATYERMEDPERPNVMLQEFIPGGEDANWMFNGYFDENSECLFGLTGRKIRQNRPYVGVTSLGVCLPNDAVAELTRKLMKSVGYRGILDSGYRYDARDGRYKLFDLNPRIGCTFRLFVSDDGMDVARALYLDLTGQRIVAGPAVAGRKWMVEDMDVASAFHYWRDGALRAGEWLRSLRGVREFAFFARDDLRPLISMVANDFRELFRRFRKGQRATSEIPPLTFREFIASPD